MALKSLFVAGLVFAAIAVEMSEAQFQINPNGINFNLFGIQVSLYCTPDGNMGILGLATPPFKGADVLFQCGTNETIAKATTNSFGISYLVTSPVPVLPFFPPQNNCKLVVNTTLSTCNPALPSIGGLQSNLSFVGASLLGHLNVANFAPVGFYYSPNF